MRPGSFHSIPQNPATTCLLCAECWGQKDQRHRSAAPEEAGGGALLKLRCRRKIASGQTQLCAGLLRAHGEPCPEPRFPENEEDNLAHLSASEGRMGGVCREHLARGPAQGCCSTLRQRLQPKLQGPTRWRQGAGQVLDPESGAFGSGPVSATDLLCDYDLQSLSFLISKMGLSHVRTHLAGTPEGWGTFAGIISNPGDVPLQVVTGAFVARIRSLRAQEQPPPLLLPIPTAFDPRDKADRGCLQSVNLHIEKVCCVAGGWEQQSVTGAPGRWGTWGCTPPQPLSASDFQREAGWLLTEAAR